MYLKLDDFETGLYGMSITLNTADIDQLIANLNAIKENKEKHFHFYSNHEGSGGVGDVAFYHNTDKFENNMKTDKL